MDTELHSSDFSSLSDGLQFLSSLVRHKGVRKSDMMEVQDVFLNYTSSAEDISKYRSIVSFLENDEYYAYGSKKADRAYRTTKNSIMKPSYYGRVREYPFKRVGANDANPIDQIALLTEKFLEMPQASNFQFSIFHPQDLIDQFRPGYVPCLSFVDIKYRDGELCFKPFFRSCDVGEVAPYDLIHVYDLMCELIDSLRAAGFSSEINKTRILYMFSRVFFYKRKLSSLDRLDELLGPSSTLVA